MYKPEFSFIKKIIFQWYQNIKKNLKCINSLPSYDLWSSRFCHNGRMENKVKLDNSISNSSPLSWNFRNYISYVISTTQSSFCANGIVYAVFKVSARWREVKGTAIQFWFVLSPSILAKMWNDENLTLRIHKLVKNW